MSTVFKCFHLIFSILLRRANNLRAYLRWRLTFDIIFVNAVRVKVNTVLFSVSILIGIFTIWVLKC